MKELCAIYMKMACMTQKPMYLLQRYIYVQSVCI